MCGLYADLCEKYGIELPPLREKTIQRLRSLLPDFANPDNPLDVTGSGFLNGMNEIVLSMVEDENLDFIVPMCIPPQDKDDFFSPIINNSFMPLIDTVKKPIVPITFREMTDCAREYFKDKDFYYMENPDLGLKAVAHLIDYAEFLRRFSE